MKAGEKVNWKANNIQTYKCEIIAVYRVEDAMNKRILGKRVFRIAHGDIDFHVFEEQLEPIK